MRNAPARLRRASHSGGVVAPSSSCSNGCFPVKARSAAWFAASVLFETGLNFVEESSSDSGSSAGWIVEGGGDAVGDGTLKGCQIRYDRVKSLRSEEHT